MAHGPIPDSGVTIEEFLTEGRLVQKSGRVFQATETQLRFLREAAAKGRALQRADVAALNSLHAPTQ
jgi:hypothetical protein